MKIALRKQGTVSATGVVPLDPVAPDYSMGAERISAWLSAQAYDKITASTTDNDPGGTAYTGTVLVEGNNGNPTEADDWFTVGTLTDVAQVDVTDQAIQFVRLRSTVLTSGTATAFLVMEG